MKKKKLRVAVFGANGRMGQELQGLISESSRFSPYLGVVRSSSAKGYEHSIQRMDTKLIKQADVCIDFSLAENHDEVLKVVVECGVPLVSGVTGLDSKNHLALKKAAKKVAVLWSPNLSLGIAALKKTLKIAAELEDFDFQIEELHHRHKKDKPSGTALYLQKELQAHVQQKLSEPVAIRGGGVFGVHRILMMSEEETITFEHQALSRRLFAKGALAAADWIVKQPKGLYSIDDVLGSK